MDARCAALRRWSSALALGVSAPGASPRRTRRRTAGRMCDWRRARRRSTQFVDILQAAGLIDAERHWCGGTTVLVQTGDVFDRGPGVRGALDLLMRLEGEAEARGRTGRGAARQPRDDEPARRVPRRVPARRMRVRRRAVGGPARGAPTTTTLALAKRRGRQRAGAARPRRLDARASARLRRVRRRARTSRQVRQVAAIAQGRDDVDGTALHARGRAGRPASGLDDINRIASRGRHGLGRHARGDGPGAARAAVLHAG